MALTKRSESSVIYLEVKHYCLWRAIKKQVPGCDEVEANNPSTGATVLKYGYRFDTITGRAVKLEKYDTEKKYQVRYFGFKLHLVDGDDKYVLDMPYKSGILRRFLHLAHNIDWNLPLSITIFKGKKKEGAGVEETGIWFQQRGETVKAYYTKDALHGAPEAIFDTVEQRWDFKAQHRWLCEQLQNETVADIEEAARRAAPPVEEIAQEHGDAPQDEVGTPYAPPDGIDDDDVPF